MPNPNPKKKTPLELESLARSFTEESIKQVSGILSNDIDSGRRLEAAKIMLDRGWGRPMQKQTNEISGGIEILLRDIAAEKAKKK
jgi:hypothetical protein